MFKKTVTEVVPISRYRVEISVRIIDQIQEKDAAESSYRSYHPSPITLQESFSVTANAFCEIFEILKRFHDAAEQCKV